MRRAGPARIVLAVPVAAPESLDALRADCDEIVCLADPSPLIAIGLHYVDFHQVGDDEVIGALDAAQPMPSTPLPPAP